MVVVNKWWGSQPEWALCRKVSNKPATCIGPIDTPFTRSPERMEDSADNFTDEALSFVNVPAPTPETTACATFTAFADTDADDNADAGEGVFATFITALGAPFRLVISC